jgi:hypothetical protein
MAEDHIFVDLQIEGERPQPLPDGRIAGIGGAGEDLAEPVLDLVAVRSQQPRPLELQGSGSVSKISTT